MLQKKEDLWLEKYGKPSRDDPRCVIDVSQQWMNVTSLDEDGEGAFAFQTIRGEEGGRAAGRSAG